MKVRIYKSPICIRGAHLNCPLPLSLESYWSCEANCLHCLGRKLNKTWGQEQRVTNPEAVEKRLRNALNNTAPKSPLSKALHMKKAMWLGRKADPYQPIENELGVTRRLLKLLVTLKWPVVVCSRYLANAVRDEDLLTQDNVTFLIEITPGGEADWELFEHSRPTPIARRLRIARHWQQLGIHVGVRGEPFIPGYHTPEQFRTMLQRLREHGLQSYNTYNLHMNEVVLQNLHNAGLDIEKIWLYNQDRYWRPIQRQLCQIAQEEGIELGCPDYVNVPAGWKSQTNTCCGVDVSNAFTFNTHCWKRRLQEGQEADSILAATWEGLGTPEDQSMGRLLLTRRSKAFYTMMDAEL